MLIAFVYCVLLYKCHILKSSNHQFIKKGVRQLQALRKRENSLQQHWRPSKECENYTISLISFVEETMKTLKGFGEQLKIQLDYHLTQ